MARWAITGLLAAVTGILLWILWGGDPLGVTTQDEPVAESEKVQQMYLEGSTSTRYDETGARTETVEIGSGVQYVGAQTTYLTNVNFDGRDREGRQWLITSDRGVIRPAVEQLILIGNVEIKDSLGTGVFTTRKLRIKTREEIAESANKVVLKSPESTTTARGMEIDLKTNNAKLLADVKTLYHVQ